jgi:hypothetical protein
VGKCRQSHRQGSQVGGGVFDDHKGFTQHLMEYAANKGLKQHQVVEVRKQLAQQWHHG